MRISPMQLPCQNTEPDQKGPPSIYAALVYSLFQNPAPMFAGALCAAVAAIMTAVKTGNAWLWPCVALLIVTGAARAPDMHLYQRRKRSLTENEAAHWEIRYQIGAMLYAASLGIWCVVALLGSDDATAHMITVSVTLGYMAAGAGRTYGRPWIFHLQTLLACGPLSVALLLSGNPYYIGLGLLNVLFLIGIRHITTSMPHGCGMFGGDGRLAVMNHRFSEMMRLSDNQLARGGAGAADIVAACID